MFQFDFRISFRWVGRFNHQPLPVPYCILWVAERKFAPPKRRPRPFRTFHGPRYRQYRVEIAALNARGSQVTSQRKHVPETFLEAEKGLMIKIHVPKIFCFCLEILEVFFIFFFNYKCPKIHSFSFGLQIQVNTTFNALLLSAPKKMSQKNLLEMDIFEYTWKTAVAVNLTLNFTPKTSLTVA